MSKHLERDLESLQRDLLALAAEECARSESCSLSGEPATVRGDPRLLRRMIRNLIVNAEQHGKPPIEVELRAGSGQAVLSVCDEGPGVPEAERARLFLPFQRASDAGARAGTGLGLALVRQIAERHSGSVAYGPRGARASCFTVTLPVAGGPRARATGATAS